jgi:hypothetical protein
MFTEILSQISNEVIGVYNDVNNLYIPIDLENSDYQRYLNRDNPDYGNKL